MNRLAHAAVVALTSAGAMLTGPVLAQDYPVKPVRIVVPFPPGGNTDIMARLIGGQLSEFWGQRFIIENRPGGDSIIGAVAVAHAPPDGYALLLAGDAVVTMNQYLHKNLPYDPFKDFAPITMVGRSTTVVSVDAKTGPKTMRELVERARANPGRLTFGTATLTAQLAGETLKRLAGIDMVHVPYKGAAPAVQALLANEVSFLIDGLPAALPHVRAGRLRMLATTGSLVPSMPELRTISEAAGLPPFDASSWQGFFAPSGTPAAVVDKLRAGIERVLIIPEMRAKFLDNGVTINVSASADEFSALIRRDAERRARAIKEAGIGAQ